MGAEVRRVLVVEDDDGMAAEIAHELVSSGFAVERARDGVDALERARRIDHQVITLDRVLPGIDGLTVLERLRLDGVRTPILVLSALGHVDERVRGLRAGGDDYLAKPFDAVELRARVEALARRHGVPAPSRLAVGDLELDLVDRSAWRGGRAIDLAPREFRLLAFLMRHAGETVTRAMLFEEVWRYRFDPGTNLVDVHVGRLRRKIDQPRQPTIILTVRKMGFKLVVLDAPAAKIPAFA